MKVKALVKIANKYQSTHLSNIYEQGDIILIDGCFVPLSKAIEDKRPVDSFVMHKYDDNRNALCINTKYIPEEASDSIYEENCKKKKKKKDKKGKK